MKYDDTKDYSYSKLEAELLKLAKRHKFSKKLLGQEEFEKIRSSYSIYRFIVNPKAKIKLCLIAGVHGDEIAGPLAVYQMFKNPAEYFSKDICYRIYPVVSPTAFDLRRRYDDDGVELNTLNKHTLGDGKHHEIELFYEDAKNKKFDAVLSFHEDVAQDKFYAYSSGEKVEGVYKKVLRGVAKHCDILEKKIIDKQKSNKHGLVAEGHDQTIENWLRRSKKPIVYITTETPGKIDLNKRIAIDLDNLKLVNEFLLEYSA